MRSDSVKNMSAYADQNHAPSFAAAQLEFSGWIVLIANWQFMLRREGDPPRGLWFLFKLKSPYGNIFCAYLMENFSLVNSHNFLDNLLIFLKTKILISIWSQKTEKQKFNLE